MSSTNSTDTVKPFIAGGIAFVLDKFYLKQEDLMSSATFGVSVAAGTYVGGMIGGYAPDFNLPVLGNGKGVAQRAAEIGAGAGASWGFNKFMLKNDGYRDNFTQRIGVIVVSDLTAELASDFLAGRPLNFLS